MAASRRGVRKRSSSEQSYDYPLLTLAEHERNIIREAMERMDGDVARCARALGIAKSTMYEKLYTLGIKRRRIR